MVKHIHTQENGVRMINMTHRRLSCLKVDIIHIIVAVWLTIPQIMICIFR